MKIISFYNSHKALYIVLFERFKTKILPTPMPKPINSVFLKLFGNKKSNKGYDFSKVSSVFIRPGSGVGDAVVITSVITQLKDIYPGIKIGVVYGNKDEAVLKGNPLIDKSFKHGFFAYLKNRNKWDVFIDILPFFCEYNILCDFLLKPKYTIAMTKRADDKYFQNNFKNYDIYCPINLDAHMNRILESTPFKPFIEKGKEIPKYNVVVNFRKIKKVDGFWQKNKIRVLLNTGGTSRRLNKEFFENIVKNISSKYRDEIDLKILNIQYNKQFFKLKEISVLPKMSNEEFIASVATSDIVITPETSLVHLAGAFDKYLISFYAEHGEQKLWLPYENGKEYTFAELKSPELKDIKNIDTGDVLRAFDEIILKLKQK